jgi:hypothetical protein
MDNVKGFIWDPSIQIGSQTAQNLFKYIDSISVLSHYLFKLLTILVSNFSYDKGIEKSTKIIQINTSNNN